MKNHLRNANLLRVTLENLRNHYIFHDIYIFFARGSFLHSPPGGAASFRRPRGKAVYSLLNGPGWNSQGEGGSFIQAAAMHFMRILPKYLGTLTFSLNSTNIKEREGPLQGRLFVPTLRQQIRAAGKSRFVYFRFEPRMRQSGGGRRSRTNRQGRRWRTGHIAWGLYSTIRPQLVTRNFLQN